jgi:hypothetical protein
VVRLGSQEGEGHVGAFDLASPALGFGAGAAVEQVGFRVRRAWVSILGLTCSIGPFLAGDVAVFLGGAELAALVEEGDVVVDDVLVEDGLWPRVVWTLRWPSRAAPMWMGRPLTSSVANKCRRQCGPRDRR